ncbi:hypothetical protein BC567DRAFT_231227 [Phyllosticta citribraziliensis]
MAEKDAPETSRGVTFFLIDAARGNRRATHSRNSKLSRRNRERERELAHQRACIRTCICTTTRADTPGSQCNHSVNPPVGVSQGAAKRRQRQIKAQNETTHSSHADLAATKIKASSSSLFRSQTHAIQRCKLALGLGVGAVDPGLVGLDFRSRARLPLTRQSAQRTAVKLFHRRFGLAGTVDGLARPCPPRASRP